MKSNQTARLYPRKSKPNYTCCLILVRFKSQRISSHQSIEFDKNFPFCYKSWTILNHQSTKFDKIYLFASNNRRNFGPPKHQVLQTLPVRFKSRRILGHQNTEFYKKIPFYFKSLWISGQHIKLSFRNKPLWTFFFYKMNQFSSTLEFV